MTKGTRVFEYWGRPQAAHGLHKLGQLQRVGNDQFKALRSMRSGTEVKDFDGLRDAENWIAECDTWGALEKSPASV